MVDMPRRSQTYTWGWEVKKCTPSTPTRKLRHQVFLKLSGVDVKVIVGKSNVHAEDIILSAKNAVVFLVSIVRRVIETVNSGQDE